MSESTRNSPAILRIEQYRALMEVSESVASHRDLSDLIRDLAERLPRLISFHSISLMLHDVGRNVMRVHSLETPLTLQFKPGLEVPVEESPSGLVWQTQQPLILTDDEQNSPFPAVTQLFRELGVKSYCILPLTTVLRRLGAMGFGSPTKGVFGEQEVAFLQEVVKQVAVAVDNALHAQSARAAQDSLACERDRLKLLLEVTNAVVSHLDLHQLHETVGSCLYRVIPHEVTTLAILEADRAHLSLHTRHNLSGYTLPQEEVIVSMTSSPLGQVVTHGEAQCFTRDDLKQFHSVDARLLLDNKIRTLCSVPLTVHNKVIGSLNIARQPEGAFSAHDVELMTQVANQIALAVENALAYRDIKALKDKLAKEKLYLEDEIRSEYDFEEIVGESLPLRRVLQQVETVGPTDSTVLILGETGTGKELIARALHNLSPRRERAFIKINCAAIPSGLLESELFGHEKGAFTGAISQKIGRFELADYGTLFLDEVGDISMELQAKLLRVLQEQEFERLGSTRTIRVNVRLIAATNQNLDEAVAQKQFRSDLFYRLNVFPILLPPLRDRPEDIPLLVRHFAQKLSRRMNKRIETLPVEAMTALMRYPWPGNIRELENFIERAVILSHGPHLALPLADLISAQQAMVSGSATLEAMEREHIRQVLQEADWLIGGPTGAAARLGMKRTTLNSKMRRLGISRPR